MGRLHRTILRYRRALSVVAHFALIAASNYAAFWLRFDGVIPASYLVLWEQTLPWVIGIRAASFIPLRLYEGLWRYTSIWDLRNIIVGVAASSVASYVFIRGFIGAAHYPRSVFFIDSLLLVSLMGGVRLIRRVYRDLVNGEREKRVLIFGAGDAAERIVRDMKSNPSYAYGPIGFVDDDVSKVGQRIHGVPVLGTRAALATIMAATQPHEVLVAIPRADPATIRSIVRDLEPFKVPIKTLPSLRDIIDGSVTVSHIRSLNVEDLLSRAPVGLDPKPLRSLLAGKRVLVTGAGGSIGSELCRQIAGYCPAGLILLDRYENSLYAITNSLLDRNAECPVQPLVGDITDTQRLNAIFAQFRPDIVFHAAAHKHVPLMEANPCEAVKNNVFGTRTVAEAAIRHKAERFILISSDKAVNPTNIMGTTKRVAEMMVHTLGRQSATTFASVRFGNVLGSNGSVVPRFLEQIRAGGPVTVTHPEMQRYFMLIPEAVQLVLHAAAQAEQGALYVLEMGEQIKVLDMARDLIRLSGFMPEDEIPITFVGLRPGEKLVEELIGADERMEQSAIEKVFCVQPLKAPMFDHLSAQIRNLEMSAAAGEVESCVRQLREMVPTFQHDAATAYVPDAEYCPVRRAV